MKRIQVVYDPCPTTCTKDRVMIQPPMEMLQNPRFSSKRDAEGKRIYVADPRGKLYAPWSARDGTIAALDHDQAQTAADEDRCSACGLPLGDRARVFIQDYGAEPPLHIQCAVYALKACPHLVREIENVFVASDMEVHYNDDERNHGGEVLNRGRPDFAPSSDYEYVPVDFFIQVANRIADMTAFDALETLKQEAPVE